MILYYEKTPKGQPSSINFYAAYSAFLQMGFEKKQQLLKNKSVCIIIG
jgi:hypothetical protein